MILKDKDGPWCAAAIDLDQDVESSLVSIHHGADGDTTLCGLTNFAILRTPFYGSGMRDCEKCAARLRVLAAD